MCVSNNQQNRHESAVHSHNSVVKPLQHTLLEYKLSKPCILLLLQECTEVLTEVDVDVILAQAVLVRLYTCDNLKDIRYQHAEPTVIHLSTIFNRGVTTVLFLLSACGFELKEVQHFNKELHSYYFWFNQILEETLIVDIWNGKRTHTEFLFGNFLRSVHVEEKPRQRWINDNFLSAEYVWSVLTPACWDILEYIKWQFVILGKLLLICIWFPRKSLYAQISTVRQFATMTWLLKNSLGSIKKYPVLKTQFHS